MAGRPVLLPNNDEQSHFIPFTYANLMTITLIYHFYIPIKLVTLGENIKNTKTDGKACTVRVLYDRQGCFYQKYTVTTVKNICIQHMFGEKLYRIDYIMLQ